MDKKTREKIQYWLNYLLDKYEIGNDEFESFSSNGNAKLPKYCDEKEISLNFPSDYDGVTYSVEEFLDYMSDIETLVEVDKTTVRTNHIRQTIIDSRYKDWSLFQDKICSYRFNGKGYSVSIKKCPMLIGIINAKNSNYENNYGIGCSSIYLALELRYKGNGRLSLEQEDDLLERITFYLTKELDTAIMISKVVDLDKFLNEYNLVEEEIDNTIVNVNDLIGNSQMIRLYKLAKSTEDAEIKFLQYYKMIEFISPLVAKLNAYDKLNKRLDLLASSERNYKFLDSIFSVTRKYDLDVKDDYLAESVVKTCVDVNPLWDLIPERLQKQIRSHFQTGKKDFSVDDLSDEQIGSLQKQIAKMLYATRNSIVHAKSNYDSNGYELEGDELDTGNKMMDIISLSIIQWNERQPDSFKI